MIAVGIMKRILCEVVRFLLHVWVIRCVSQIPSCVLNNDFVCHSFFTGKWCVLYLVRQEMSPDRRVRPEECPELL